MHPDISCNCIAVMYIGSMAGSAAATPALRARRLTKRYASVTALDELDLDIEAGEVFCLLGANGAGKTTTLHVLLGFVAATSGHAWVAGIDVAEDPNQARRLVGYLPEVVELYPMLTGRETLTMFDQLAGRVSARDRLEAELDRVGVPVSARDARVATYSKGMRQKLGLAVMLAKQAQILLLDEPMSGLDPAAANELVALLRRLRADGVAILVVTHDIFRAHQLADRIGIMRRGKLVEQVSPTAMQPVEIERLYVHHLRDVA
jgi:ABC-2 type transport system ATP-binding protein